MSRKSTRSRSTFSTTHSVDSPSPRRGRGNVRVPAVMVAAAACMGTYAVPASATQASAPVVSRGVTIPAFYNPPAELPSADGGLIRTEPLPLGLSLPGLDGRPMPGTATRLMYKSTDSDGRPVAVTGSYIEPSAAWKGAGQGRWWRWLRAPWARVTSAHPLWRCSTRSP